MNKVEKCTTIKKHVGKKRGNREKSKKYYTLYDTCDKCPLHVYIDLTCNDNLRALSKSGNPPIEVLKEARGRLLTEFAGLSGDGQFNIVNSAIRKINGYRSRVLLLSICYRLVYMGAVDKAIECLNQSGIKCSKPMNVKETESLLGKVSGAINESKIRLRSEKRKYDGFIGESKTTKPTPNHFTEQLVVLSKYAGFRLTVDITLSEYAAYIKNMKEYVEQAKAVMYGKKYQ